MLATTRDQQEFIDREILAGLARDYLTSLQQRAPIWAYGRDAHEHLAKFGHLPAKACCAPAPRAVKGS